MLCCTYVIGLDWPAWRRSVADSSQAHEQTLRWNGERTPDRYAKASANQWYDELRKQNDAGSLLGSSMPLHALHGILFMFYFAHLCYTEKLSIGKCTISTTKLISRIVATYWVSHIYSGQNSLWTAPSLAVTQSHCSMLVELFSSD